MRGARGYDRADGQPIGAGHPGDRGGLQGARQPDVNLPVVPSDTGASTGPGKVRITLEPGRVGRNVVEAVVFGADGGLIAIPELRLTFTESTRHVGPLDAGLVDRSGYWGSDTLDLPLTGTWTMRATVRVSDSDQVIVSKTVKDRPVRRDSDHRPEVKSESEEEKVKALVRFSA